MKHENWPRNTATCHVKAKRKLMQRCCLGRTTNQNQNQKTHIVFAEAVEVTTSIAGASMMANKPTNRTMIEKYRKKPVVIEALKWDGSRLVLRFRCFIGRHDWHRVSTQPNGIGFLDECTRCGCGRYLNWLGVASETGELSATQMQQWRSESNPQNVKCPSTGATE